MAIIHCYACGKRISDKAPVCPHCGEVRSDDPEVISEGRRRKQAAKVRRLNSLAMAALILFLLGGLLFTVVKNHPDFEWVVEAMMGVGFVGYIALRVMLLLEKRKGGK